MRALVVDDSSTMRTVLKIILKRRGFDVLEGRNGLDALSVLEANGPVELMLVDWNMPEMNGFEFVEQVRKLHLHDAAKIMMVTTETGSGEMVQALSAGADEYIMKPFTPDIVAEKLQILGW